MKEYLVGFKWNGHYGSLHGAYILNREDYLKLKEMQEDEVEIWFCEIEGKHSEGYIGVDKFYLVSDKEDDIESFKKLFGNTFGSYEPLDRLLEHYDNYYYDEEEEDEE